MLLLPFAVPPKDCTAWAQSAKTTMREYDDLCLDELPAFNAKDIKRIREHVHVSQPVFARYLNTSESTIQKWETGQKKPSGMALRLLRVVEKHGLEVLA